MSLNHQTSDWIVVSRTKINQIWKLLKYNQWSIYNCEAKRLSLNNLISLSKKKNSPYEILFEIWKHGKYDLLKKIFLPKRRFTYIISTNFKFLLNQDFQEWIKRISLVSRYSNFSRATVDSINENYIYQCTSLVISVFVSSIFFFFFVQREEVGRERVGRAGRKENIKNFFHKASSQVETPLDWAWKPAPCSFKRILAGFFELVQTVFRDFPFFSFLLFLASRAKWARCGLFRE